jgi:hypothetical protein
MLEHNVSSTNPIIELVLVVDAHFRCSTLRIEPRQFPEHQEHSRNTDTVPNNSHNYNDLYEIETQGTVAETLLLTS